MLHTAGAAPRARVSAAEGCRRSGSHCVHSPTFQTVAHRKNFLSKHKGLGEGDCRMFHKCLPLPEAAWVSDLKVSHLYSDCVYIIKRITLYILCFKTQSTCTVSVSLLSCDWERKKSKSRHTSWSYQIWYQKRQVWIPPRSIREGLKSDHSKHFQRCIPPFTMSGVSVRKQECGEVANRKKQFDPLL